MVRKFWNDELTILLLMDQIFHVKKNIPYVRWYNIRLLKNIFGVLQYLPTIHILGLCQHFWPMYETFFAVANSLIPELWNGAKIHHNNVQTVTPKLGQGCPKLMSKSIRGWREGGMVVAQGLGVDGELSRLLNQALQQDQWLWISSWSGRLLRASGIWQS